MKLKNNLVLIQARMTSTRLPGKSLAEINGIKLVSLFASRVSSYVDSDYLHFVVPESSENDVLVEFLQSEGLNYIRGSEFNVMDRYVKAIDAIGHYLEIDSVTRLTGDCFAFQGEILTAMLEILQRGNFDYVSNRLPASFPDGLDVEIFTRQAFARLVRLEFLDQLDYEHVTLGFYRYKELFKIANLYHSENRSHQRATIDYLDDLQFWNDFFSGSAISPLHFNMLIHVSKSFQLNSREVNLDLRKHVFVDNEIEISLENIEQFPFHI